MLGVANAVITPTEVAAITNTVAKTIDVIVFMALIGYAF
jgi:hypothetical protein